MSVEKSHDEELDLMTLTEAAKIAGYTPEYLNMLARKEKLQAMKIGRNWFTTQTWINDFFHPEMKAARLAAEAAQKEAEAKNGSAKKEIAAKSILDEPVSAEGKLENFYFDEIKEAARFEKQGLLQSRKISRRWWQSSMTFSLAVIIILIVLGLVQLQKIKNNSGNNNLSSDMSLPAEAGKIETADAASQTDTHGVVLGTQTQNTGVLLASEKFSIKELKFGGDVSLLAASYENFPLQLTDVRSQIVTTKNQDEFQLLVYWKTNKLALSNLTFAKMGSDATKTLKEDDYGFSHSVIIPALDPATAYTYVISATDKWGNKITSDKYSTYTGAKNVSVFDLIVKAAEDTFGWAMKK